MLENNLFYRALSSRRFSRDTETGLGTLLILEYMINRLDLNAETKLTFELLRECISLNVPNDDLISAVFYLTRKEKYVGALRQVIEAYDPKTNTKSEISPHIFSESIKGGTYYHPITLEQIDAKTYNEQVITYFMPTTDFLESLSQKNAS